MASTTSEIRAPARLTVRTLDGQVPFGVRWLARMSTSRWRPHSAIHPAVAESAAGMVAEGWMIRGAWARNYLLWRSGRTMRERRFPFLVLPMAYAGLSALHINVFLAVELIGAKAGLRRGADGELSPAETAELALMLNPVAAEAGVTIANPLRIHREAARALECMVNH